MKSSKLNPLSGDSVLEISNLTNNDYGLYKIEAKTRDAKAYDFTTILLKIKSNYL